MRNHFSYSYSVLMLAAFSVAMVLLGSRYLVARAQSTPLIRIGTSSNDASAVVYFAQDAGFFNKAGVRVEIQPDTNGAAVAAAVMSGALDIGVSNVVSIALAHAKNLPLVLIAPSAIYSSTAPTTALLVEKTSPITSGSSLNGKTVAVDGLNNITQVAADGWIDSHGGDSRTVHFIELPFSEMGSSLQRHIVDAAVIAEPFLTEAKAGGRIIGYPYDSIGSRFIINGWFANTEWVAKNQDAVQRFSQALFAAARWANSHRAQTAPMLVAHSRISPAIVADMTRATYAETLDPSLLQPEIDAAARYGVLSSRFPARDLLFDARSHSIR